MARYRCHFVDVHDRIKAYEEIDAGSLLDAIDRANAMPMRDRTMTPSRFGRAADGFTALGGKRNCLQSRMRVYGVARTN
jgi:hypothetical protein